MRNIMVTGIGTNVGKSVVSAVLATVLEADYWKPIECGEGDSQLMKEWLDRHHTIHPPAYKLRSPLSPHHAAALEDQRIDPVKIILPKAQRRLVIEGVGGAMVPLREDLHTLELFSQLNCVWVIVSRHYLGSINHTLLTIESLKSRSVPIAGLIFNGEPHPFSEEAILKLGGIPCIGRILPENSINKETIQRIAQSWKIQI